MLRNPRQANEARRDSVGVGADTGFAACVCSITERYMRVPIGPRCGAGGLVKSIGSKNNNSEAHFNVCVVPAKNTEVLHHSEGSSICRINYGIGLSRP